MLAPVEKLPRANGMMQTIFALSNILSPALAAIIIGLPALARQAGLTGWLAGLSNGTALAILVDAATFLLAAATLLFVAIPSPRRADLAAASAAPRPSIWADVRSGMRYIWDRRPLLWLLATFTVANFAFAPLVVLPPLLLKYTYAVDWMARGLTYEAALAFFNTALGIGGVLGGVLVSVWGGLKR